jgi:hypothetical protein
MADMAWLRRVIVALPIQSEPFVTLGERISALRIIRLPDFSKQILAQIHNILLHSASWLFAVGCFFRQLSE